MDPRPLTVRQLLDMFDAHQRDRWDHTAQMLAAWSTDADPRDLNPYRRRRPADTTPDELRRMRRNLERNRRRQ